MLILEKRTLLFFCFISYVISSNAIRLSDYYKERNFQCQHIQEELCIGIGYNFTTMPNIMGNENQKEASVRFREFKSLMDYKSSTKFRFFLCSLFFPMCTGEVNIGIPACRPLCEEMRIERAPIMKTFGFEWSDSIDCSKLPWTSVRNHLCIPHPSYMNENGNKKFHTNNLDQKIHDLVNEKKSTKHYKKISDISQIDTKKTTTSIHNKTAEKKTVRHNRKIEPKLNSSKTQSCFDKKKWVFLKENKRCFPRCGSNIDFLFSSHDKKLTFQITSVGACICFIFTAVTIITYFLDSSRFRYPKKPVIFIALCYNFLAFGYLMRSFKGFSNPYSCLHNSVQNENYLIINGTKDTNCYATFFILYFFQMSAYTWWIVLNLTWLLAAALKWGQEAIEQIGVYFHVIAWTLPSIQTILVFLQAKVDGDELTGICHVGNFDPESLMRFVITPMVIYLILSTIIMCFGFIYLLKIRKHIRYERKHEAKNLEILMLKIILFTLLFAISVISVLVVCCYQYSNTRKWLEEANKAFCFNESLKEKFGDKEVTLQFQFMNGKKILEYSNPLKTFSSNGSNSNFPKNSVNGKEKNLHAKFISNFKENFSSPYSCSLQQSIPSFSLFIIRIILTFFPGIMTGIMWIGNIKTINTWISCLKLPSHWTNKKSTFSYIQKNNQRSCFKKIAFSMDQENHNIFDKQNHNSENDFQLLIEESQVVKLSNNGECHQNQPKQIFEFDKETPIINSCSCVPNIYSKACHQDFNIDIVPDTFKNLSNNLEVSHLGKNLSNENIYETIHSSRHDDCVCFYHKIFSK